MNYTNTSNIHIAVAVWLATDHYKRSSNPKVISATGLLKTPKAIILASRVEDTTMDISQLVASKVGTAVHDSIERIWSTDFSIGLKALGFANLSDRVLINPSKTELDGNPNCIPVYMEQRESKTINGYVISGQYDFIIEDTLTDFKTTKTFNWNKESSTEKFMQQGSIYRWLNPTIVKMSYMDIVYIFKDWMPNVAKGDKDYPQHQVVTKRINLMSIEQTEAFIKRRLDIIDKYAQSPEEDMPTCNSEDLWRNKTVWKYYRDPNKRARSTKNFDNPSDAGIRLAKDKYQGIVVEVRGQPKACLWCNALPICQQAKTMIKSGELVIE